MGECHEDDDVDAISTQPYSNCPPWASRWFASPLSALWSELSPTAIIRGRIKGEGGRENLRMRGDGIPLGQIVEDEVWSSSFFLS